MSERYFITYACLNLPLSRLDCERLGIEYTTDPDQCARLLEAALKMTGETALWRVEVTGPLFGQPTGHYSYITTTSQEQLTAAIEFLDVLNSHLDGTLYPTTLDVLKNDLGQLFVNGIFIEKND